MSLRPVFFLTFACCAGLLAAAEPSHKLDAVNELPEGLSPKLAAELDPQGHRVSGPDGPVAEVWLAKSVAVKPGFKHLTWAPSVAGFVPETIDFAAS